MYIDEQLTIDMQGWLNTEPAQRDLMKGAEMVLKLTRNRYLYQNISRNPQKFASKIEYELKKHLTIRLDRKTIQDVVKMDKELIPAVAETLATFQPVISSDDDTPQDATIAKGKRVDHDSLPEEIRQLWEDNKDIYFRLKQTFETLKTMKDALPCDRYEYLKQLEELDARYRDNMSKYDHFNPDNQAPAVQRVNHLKTPLKWPKSQCSPRLSVRQQKETGRAERIRRSGEIRKAAG